MKVKQSFARLAVLSTAILPLTDVLAAGCVASHGAGMQSEIFGVHDDSTLFSSSSQAKDISHFEATLAYRTFTSDHHFVGGKQQQKRDIARDQVINDSEFYDFALTYKFNPTYSTTVTLPYVDHDRSSTLKDSNGKVFARYDTQARGLGDIRVVGNKWLWDPSEAKNGNIQLGLGLSLPTGKKDVKDVFTKYDKATNTYSYSTREVDQSIQPGIGGYGIIVDVYAYRNLIQNLTGYFSGTYTITPQDTNGVKTNRSNPFEETMSIADTYVLRTGVEYAVWPKYHVMFSYGLRDEVVPVRDVMGGSDGFRRPGEDLSVEPGFSARIEGWNVSAYVPLSIYRNRFQSVADKRYEASSASNGKPQWGDAAFSDYAVTLAVSKAF